MRKFYLLTLITLSSFAFSQEINEAYLASLPDDIREDLMARVEKKGDFEKEVYRSIDTSSDIKKIDYEDDVFGADFFDTFQTSFMPINSPNLDDEYVLDFGDVLSIQLIGQKNSIDSYQVSRDGSINIPDIGKLYLSGLSLDQASKMISSKIKQTYIGIDSYISIENIRDVSVLVSGNAYNPGIYTLNGSSNMLHALHAAGGIGKYGSYRSIKLIRDGEIIDNLDIYDILINGKFGSKIRLRSGDMIFVDPRFNVVTLQGAFKRLTSYELFDDQNLSDAIYYSNGLSVNADLSNIFLYRSLDGEIKQIPILSISQFQTIKSKDLDKIYVRSHSYRTVTISGALRRPGTYTMTEGKTIFDLINKAGGYSKNAFPEGAIYLNEEAKEINKIAAEKLYSNFIDGLLEVIQQSSTGQSDISSLVAIANQIKDSDPNGRIIIDLKDDNVETLLRDKDSVYIPEKNNNIFIYGEVYNQGSQLFKQGAKLDYYLEEASGIKDTADESAIYILYPNGRTKKFSRKRNLFAAQSQNINIETGSIIYVPRKIDNTLASRLTAQAYATILGNIGLTLASISTINNNK